MTVSDHVPLALKRFSWMLAFMCAILGLWIPIALAASSHAVPTPTKRPRIIAIGGGITEMIFALGHGRYVVATDTSSYFPQKAAQLPKVGYQRSLSVAGILALKPTLVVAAEEAGPPKIFRQLEQTNVNVVQLESPKTFEQLLKLTSTLGHLLQVTDKAQAIRRDLKYAFAAIEKQRAALKGQPPKILFVMQHSAHSPMVAGIGTSVHSLIELSGATNAATDIHGFRTLTPEALVLWNPDVILTSGRTLEVIGNESALWSLPGMKTTMAGRAGNLIVMDTLMVLSLSTRSAVATKQLLSHWQNLVRYD